MAIKTTASKAHWNYFLALERDLELASRYVEFCNENMQTFSIEFAHLLLAAASEVDVVAKLLCQKLAPGTAHNNINQYKSTLTHLAPEIMAMEVFVHRFGLTLTPWHNWSNGNNPDWWRSYNNVKHQRDSHFKEATLKNSLNALAALYCLVFLYYRTNENAPNTSARNKATTRSLKPDPSLMRFDESYYNAYIITE